MTKVNFVNGTWRVIEYDQLCERGPLTIFNLEGRPVLTAVTRNMTFFEPVAEEPEKTSRDVDRQGYLPRLR